MSTKVETFISTRTAWSLKLGDTLNFFKKLPPCWCFGGWSKPVQVNGSLSSGFNGIWIRPSVSLLECRAQDISDVQAPLQCVSHQAGFPRNYWNKRKKGPTVSVQYFERLLWQTGTTQPWYCAMNEWPLTSYNRNSAAFWAIDYRMEGIPKAFTT